MPTVNTLFAPLDEVDSADLNAWQRGILTQRAPGPTNTLATGLDTPSNTHQVKTVVVAMANAAAAPTVTGLVDNAIDWRDRHVTVDLYYDPTRDIRPGEADDDKQAQVHATFSFYTNTGGRFWTVAGIAGLAVYVDNTNGYLWCKKPLGYAYGTMSATCQLRERS